MTTAKLFLLIDHANIPYDKISLSGAIDRWIERLSKSIGLPHALNLRVKAYGGWFAGEAASSERYNAAAFYQQAVPTAINAHGHLCRIWFEFADTMEALAPGDRNAPFAVRNTVVARMRMLSVGRKASAPKCQEATCKIREVQKWLHRDRACTSPTCPHSFSTFFERLEQKQVDVHLATDLLLLALGGGEIEHLAVLSDDVDFVPSLVAARRYAKKVLSVFLIRCNSCPDQVRDTMRAEQIDVLEVPSSCDEGV
jgi:hypothetical protein